MEKFQPTKSISINNDGIGFVEYYEQFAYANMSEQSRIEAITNIASICYANPKAFGSESLYNRLAAESAGLPSSSFEFVPVLLHWTKVKAYKDEIDMDNNPLTKFGEWIDSNYLLTNFRAIVYFYEQFGIDLRSHFNTQEECDIIAKHFHVFNFKVDLSTRAQMVRHRVNWQELSRRYVSGNKVAFDFYESEKMSKVMYTDKHLTIGYTQEDLIDLCLHFYEEALKAGIKPEEARRILPQAMYTQIWGGFQPTQLVNFFKLRLDQHAQREIREVAQAIQSLIGGSNETITA